MTDKEQIRAIIKQYAKKGERLFLEASESNKGYAESYWDGYKDCADGLLRELDDMQEESGEDLEEFINTIKLLTSNTALLTFEYGCREGANWQKEHMMANSVELTVREGEHGDPYLIYVPDVEAMGLKAGDKIKVLIVKED